MRTREQIYPCVTPALRKRLALYASKKGTSYSSVVEAALVQYLDADTTDRALLLRRLDRIGRDLASLERDLDVLSHAFGLFLQVWFAHTPAIDEGMKRSAEQNAFQRYSRFLDHLAAEAMKSESFVRQVATGDAGEDESSDDGKVTP
jgi:hypothetical protein